MHKMDTDSIRRLYRAIAGLNTPEDCAAFFEDACTIQEIEAIAQRFEVACRLSDGKRYAQVSEETSASTATICRVNKCLMYGSGGYQKAIERLNKEERNDV